MAPRVITWKVIESKRGERLMTAGGHIYTVNQKRPGAKVPVINCHCIKQAMCVGTAKTSYIQLHYSCYTHESPFAWCWLIRSSRKGNNEYNPYESSGTPEWCPFTYKIQGVTNRIEDEEILIRLPEHQNVARIVNRTQNSTRPRNPITLDEFRIEPPYNLSIGGDVFLQLDTILSDETKLIMLYTEPDLRKLCTSSAVFNYGTFKSVPR